MIIVMIIIISLSTLKKYFENNARKQKLKLDGTFKMKKTTLELSEE